MGAAYGQVWGRKHTAQQRIPTTLVESARENKRCSRCGVVKRKTEFYKDPTKFDGLRIECMECTDSES